MSTAALRFIHNDDELMGFLFLCSSHFDTKAKFEPYPFEPTKNLKIVLSYPWNILLGARPFTFLIDRPYPQERISFVFDDAIRDMIRYLDITEVRGVMTEKERSVVIFGAAAMRLHDIILRAAAQPGTQNWALQSFAIDLRQAMFGARATPQGMAEFFVDQERAGPNYLLPEIAPLVAHRPKEQYVIWLSAMDVRVDETYGALTLDLGAAVRISQHATHFRVVLAPEMTRRFGIAHSERTIYVPAVTEDQDSGDAFLQAEDPTLLLGPLVSVRHHTPEALRALREQLLAQKLPVAYVELHGPGSVDKEMQSMGGVALRVDSLQVLLRDARARRDEAEKKRAELMREFAGKSADEVAEAFCYHLNGQDGAFTTDMQLRGSNTDGTFTAQDYMSIREAQLAALTNGGGSGAPARGFGFNAYA